MTNASELSKIEVKGLEARLYDFLLLAGTFGLYQSLLKRVIRDMDIKTGDKILDMGAGTGKNACMMRKYVGDEGFILGLDIGEIMLKKFNRKCKRYENVKSENKRIDEPLAYKNEFDKVFISFVIHGFTQENRIKIVENAHNSLKPGGKFFIFDWAEFDIKSAGTLLKFFMYHVECPLALDFIKQDFKAILKEQGFSNIQENSYAGKKIMLLSGEKT